LTLTSATLAPVGSTRRPSAGGTSAGVVRHPGAVSTWLDHGGAATTRCVTPEARRTVVRSTVGVRRTATVVRRLVVRRVAPTEGVFVDKTSTSTYTLISYRQPTYFIHLCRFIMHTKYNNQYVAYTCNYRTQITTR